MLFKWLKFYFIFFLSIFFFFDEEPFFDVTDWNVVHIFFFVICVFVIVFENVLKAKYGQFLFKDQTLLFATFSYWFFLENYLFVIIIFFCFHCLTPLEIELFELVEVYNNVLVWYTYSVLPNLFILVLIFFLSIMLNFFINWNNKKFILVTAVLIYVTLVLSLFFVLWDFLFSSLTSQLFWNNFKQYYIQTKSSLTYNNMLFATDQFDWHKDQANFFMIRFEDLYMFLIQFINIICLVNCIVVWFFFINDILINLWFYKEVSYLFLGVCNRWLDNCLYNFFFSYFLLFFAGFKISLKILIELWDYNFLFLF